MVEARGVEHLSMQPKPLILLHIHQPFEISFEILPVIRSHALDIRVNILN